MSWVENFWQATVIMVLGMGVVFLFLAALITMMQVMARLIAKYAPPPPAPVAAAPAVPVARGDEAAIVAAITAAVKRYSTDKKSRTS